MDQHLASLCCQSNGNALKQSSNPREPNKLYDNKSIRELAVECFLRKVENIDIAPPREVRTELTAIYGPELSDDMRLERSELGDENFGWATRRTLKHPVVKPRVIEFLRYLFLRGNIKGKSKCSPHAMRSLAAKFGTSNIAFDTEEFWHAATVQSGGEPEFKAEDIPEEWRVKQLISQFVAELHKKKRVSENMTPEDIRIKLLYLLGKGDSLVNIIPGNHDILAEKLIALDKLFHKITHDDMKKLHEASEPKYNLKCRQAISAACKNMDGEVTMEQNVDTTETIIDNINIDGNEDTFMDDENARLVAEHYENEIEDENDNILSDDS